MDLSPEAGMDLCPSRRLGRVVALDEKPRLALDQRGCVSLLLEEWGRELAVPARIEKLKPGLSGVAGSFLLNGQALRQTDSMRMVDQARQTLCQTTDHPLDNSSLPQEGQRRSEFGLRLS